MTGLDIRRNAVMIDVACNDPDNGLFANHADMIQVGRDFLELEANYRAPTFRDLGDTIRLSRRKWRIIGSKDWVGNWCWNGYWMEIPEALRFLTWLQSTQLYSCSQGEERLFNIWNSRKPMDKDDIAFLDRLLGKPSMYHAA